MLLMLLHLNELQELLLADVRYLHAIVWIRQGLRRLLHLRCKFLLSKLLRLMLHSSGTVSTALSLLVSFLRCKVSWCLLHRLLDVALVVNGAILLLVAFVLLVLMVLLILLLLILSLLLEVFLLD